MAISIFTENNRKFLFPARYIWQELDSKRKFKNWMDFQIEKYGLLEWQDFITKNVKNPNGRPRKEFYLTKTASHLILEDSKNFEKGLDLRKSHDKRGYDYADLIRDMVKDPVKVLEFALEVAKKEKENSKTISLLMGTKRTYTSTDLAKELGFTSARAFNEDLYQRKIIFKDQKGDWQPYSFYSNKGYFDKKQEILANNKEVYYLKFTQKGRDMVLNLFHRDGE